MIKLKDILLENTAPDILIPRRMEDRLERMIRTYIRSGSEGGLNLANKNLTVLPAILKDITVNGYFDCSGNNLTSLENSPKIVNGTFNCKENLLTTLKGAPSIVKDSFLCTENKLTSLEFAPSSVGGNFNCGRNFLTSDRKSTRLNSSHT